jgi:hypothetical protein
MKKMILFWLPMPLLAVVNGAIREFTYQKALGESDAHQLSALFLILIFIGYAFLIRHKLRLTNIQQAITCGFIWVLLTIVFETVMEFWVLHETLEQVLSHYRHGEWWPLVLTFVGLLPLIILSFSSNLRDSGVNDREHAH